MFPWFSAAAESLRLEAPALFERSVSERLRLSADGAAVELDRGELIEDDGPAAGFSYRGNEETLAAGEWVRKTLIVADPRAEKAWLILGSRDLVDAVVNGKPRRLSGGEKLSRLWRAYPLDAGDLKAGENTIVLKGPGTITLSRDDEYAAGSTDRARHPNRSAKSRDGGKTWDDARLGAGGATDGEYNVRLRLDRYVADGAMTLPVVDAGNLQGRPIAPPRVGATSRLCSMPEGHRATARPDEALAKAATSRPSEPGHGASCFPGGPLSIAVDAESGRRGKVAVRARTGASPLPDAPGWSAWRELGPAGGAIDAPQGRYLQISVSLAAGDPLETPRLRAVTIEASSPRAADWTRDLRVVELRNPEIVRTSLPFRYEPFDHARLRELRERCRLDDVVRGAMTEFEMITRLAAWACGQLKGGHLEQVYPPWDGLEILKPGADGTPVGGFCLQYNCLFLQACESFGLCGRVISTSAGTVTHPTISGAHEIVEVWSNEHAKWMYVDAFREAPGYAVDAVTGVPLSAFEIRERKLRAARGEQAPPARLMDLSGAVKPGKTLDHLAAFAELRMVPRSDFLLRKAPLPPNLGRRGWFWTGFAVWEDPHASASRHFSTRITRPGNWEWTVNRAHLVLEASATAGEIFVHLDTVTPGFETFLASIDGGSETPVQTGFAWTLHAGKNSLEVASRNTAGRKGPASRVLLERRPGSAPQ